MSRQLTVEISGDAATIERVLGLDDVELRARFDEASRDALELADRMVELVEHEIGLTPDLARAAVNYRQQRTLMRRLRALAREAGY